MSRDTLICDFCSELSPTKFIPCTTYRLLLSSFVLPRRYRSALGGGIQNVGRYSALGGCVCHLELLNVTPDRVRIFGIRWRSQNAEVPSAPPIAYLALFVHSIDNPVMKLRSVIWILNVVLRALRRCRLFVLLHFLSRTVRTYRENYCLRIEGNEFEGRKMREQEILGWYYSALRSFLSLSIYCPVDQLASVPVWLAADSILVAFCATLCFRPQPAHSNSTRRMISLGKREYPKETLNTCALHAVGVSEFIFGLYRIESSTEIKRYRLTGVYSLLEVCVCARSRKVGREY